MPMLVPEDINALDSLGVDTTTQKFDQPGLHQHLNGMEKLGFRKIWLFNHGIG